MKRYSLRTEQANSHWIRRDIRCNDLRHARESGGAEVEGFLSDLAVHVATLLRDAPARIGIEHPLHAGAAVVTRM
ncbi:phage integrase N-terminal SAM-like domain-containing protein [Lysobacter brunescens]|uniref:Phage integrase N-terminal SAM-like domain-containing protein n=2 Tax=Lysobacter brunescens TaxID=262323 RepID=A0ABW2Y928_9GAMM